MRNNKNLEPLLFLCWFSALLLFSISKAAATPVLEGVWDNYTLGTHGVWQLSYQDSTDVVSATMDFDGDFLGNGSDPEPLTLIGAKNSVGLASITASDHVSFGDVVATIDQDGNISLHATNVPDPDIKSVNLTGEISESDFTFLHNIELESGSVTYGSVITSTPPSTITITLPPSDVPLPASIWLLISSLGVLFSFGRRDRQLVT